LDGGGGLGGADRVVQGRQHAVVRTGGDQHVGVRMPAQHVAQRVEVELVPVRDGDHVEQAQVLPGAVIPVAARRRLLDHAMGLGPLLHAAGVLAAAVSLGPALHQRSRFDQQLARARVEGIQGGAGSCRGRRLHRNSPWLLEQYLSAPVTGSDPPRNTDGASPRGRIQHNSRGEKAAGRGYTQRAPRRRGGIWSGSRGTSAAEGCAWWRQRNPVAYRAACTSPSTTRDDRSFSRGELMR